MLSPNFKTVFSSKWTKDKDRVFRLPSNIQFHSSLSVLFTSSTLLNKVLLPLWTVNCSCCYVQWHPSRKNRRPRRRPRSSKNTNRWAWSPLSPEPVRPIGGTLSGTRILLSQVSSPSLIISNFQILMIYHSCCSGMKEPFHACLSLLLSLYQF